jgi:hypothetical protein
LVVSEGLTSSYAKLTNIPTKTSNTQFLTLDGSGNVGKKTIGGTMYTGSTYPITSSWALKSITASYALNAQSAGTTLNTGSTYPITSSWALLHILQVTQVISVIVSYKISQTKVYGTLHIVWVQKK